MHSFCENLRPFSLPRLGIGQILFSSFCSSLPENTVVPQARFSPWGDALSNVPGGKEHTLLAESLRSFLDLGKIESASREKGQGLYSTRTLFPVYVRSTVEPLSI